MAINLALTHPPGLQKRKGSNRPICGSIHELLVVRRATNVVYTRFLDLLILSPDVRTTPSYDAFIGWLAPNGHGQFPLDHLPLLVRAMRDCGIDPEPIIQIALGKCLETPEINGSLNDEISRICGALGDICKRAAEDMRDLSTTDLRFIQLQAGKLKTAADAMAAECDSALRSV
jgi:hypothetical protein